METVLHNSPWRRFYLEVSVSFVGVARVLSIFKVGQWDAMPIGMFHENHPPWDLGPAMSQLSLDLLFLTQNWHPNHDTHIAGLVNVDITIEHHHVYCYEWENPLFLWGIFYSYVNVYQRVPHSLTSNPSRLSSLSDQPLHPVPPSYSLLTASFFLVVEPRRVFGWLII